MTAIAQASFTKGELSPSLYGRIDLALFYTALRTCRNCIVRPYGGIMNRSGSQFCTEVKNSAKKVRLIEFVFSSSQAYVLEVGEQYIRFISNGGYVMDGNDPYEVETPYLETDLEILKYVQNLDVMTICHPDYKQRQLNRFAATNWTLTEFANTEGPFLDININEAATVFTNGVSGNITVESSSDLFTADHVGLLLYIEQSPDDFTKKWEVNKDVEINAIRRAGGNYYQSLEEGKTGTVRPSTIDGNEADGDPGVRWKYLHSGFGIVRITALVNARKVTATVIKRLPDQVASGGISRAITDVDSGADEVPGDPPIPGSPARVTCPAHEFETGDSVTISGVTGAVEANGTHAVIVIDANMFDLADVTTTGVYTGGGTATRTLSSSKPTYKWAFEAWGGAQKYPAATSYYQQRQIFGGSDGLPHTIWMSRSAGFTDFGTSIPLLDDDAITFKVVADQMNEIRHFVRMKNLIVLTSEAAWIVQKEQGNPVPITDPQDEGGASHVRPLKVGKKAIYVEEMGNAIRSLGYEFSSDTYEGDDLTMTANHLFFGKRVVSWAYQKVPFSCVWIVLDDGGLVGLTYLPKQEVVGWHRHDTDGYFESVCCVPEGNENAVYVVVRRYIDGGWKRYIERFTSRFYTDIVDAFHVDSGLTYDGRTAGAGVLYTLSGGVDWTYQETLTFTTTTNFFTGASDVGDMIVLHDEAGEALRLTIVEYVSAVQVKVLASRTVPAEFRAVQKTGFQVGRNTFTGLDHLEGETVSILADGNVEPQQVVTNGSIQLAYPSVVVHAGLPVESDVETLDANLQGQSIQDRMKMVRGVTLVVEKTRGLRAGPDADNLLEYLPERSGQYDQPIAETTGPLEINILSTWTKGGRVFIRQSDPLPMSILAAIPEVVVSGS